MYEPKGRLELTWSNKHLRLLSHEDETYEWVSPADHRVAEVRLLHDHSELGSVGLSRAADNLLIRGDALHALQSLNHLPEFATEVTGKVRLCYIDPPFNTGQAFRQYDDGLEHSVWLTMMRDRLVQIRDLLAPDGSVWLHLDDTEIHRARCVMDEVFGPDRFVGSIIWVKADTLRNDARRFSVSHDQILVYAAPEWEANRLPRTAEMDEVYKNPDKDRRGPWLSGTLISPHYRASGDYVVDTPGGAQHRAPQGTSWRVPRETFDRLLADDRIWFGKDGRGTPQQKLFLSEAKDRVVDTVWGVKAVGGNRQSKAEIKRLFPNVDPYETPKPEKLLARVIHVATEPGDLVLDCFAGSGTTAAVAHKMGRRWITCESSAETLTTFTLPRLAQVVAGEDLGGVTSTTGWGGGGGFRVLDVAPSMYAEVSGMVFLAEWATNGNLAEVVAAQLGFIYESGTRPFCGRNGRRRLAVVDGLVDVNVVRIVVGELLENEQVVIAGTSIDPGARSDLPKGSSLRKIPDALLQIYQRESRLAQLLPPSSPTAVVKP